ncbi:MAG TPA: hypothetical protein DIC49_06505, partial [Gammaproteobacteria bacterium]|nr:hypothetical protein [Gammaproteobacteria bacterium]
MIQLSRGIHNTLMVAVLTLVSPMGQSASVVTGYWNDIGETETLIQAGISPKRAQDSTESRLLKLNLALLRESLKAGTATHILLPDPYGGAVEFALRPSSVMPKQLAARYPGIRAFEGTALNDPATTLRLELTEKGLSAQVLGAGSRWLVDPVAGLGPEFARSYRYSKSYHTKDDPFCELESAGFLDGR